MSRVTTLAWLLVLCASHAAQRAEAQDAGPLVPNAQLGAPCQSADDCGAGLVCLTAGAGVTGGVPPGGLCTASCDAEPNVCEFISPGAACVHLALGGSLTGDFCLQGCTLDRGGPSTCHGRLDFACTSEAPTTRTCVPGPFGECSPFFSSADIFCRGCDDPIFDDAGVDVCEGHCVQPLCLPTCARDADCQGGLACNPATGFCDSSGRQGGAPGANCGDGFPQCAGTCRFSSCVEACVVGQSCGPPDATNARCSDLSGASIGDRGECRILCNCAADCRDLGSSWACADSPTVAVFGFRGECTEQFSTLPDAGGLDDGACTPPPPRCPFGERAACRTDDGCLGMAQCRADGTYSRCVCVDAGSDSPVGVLPDGAVSMDAGPHDAGGLPMPDAGAFDAGSDAGVEPTQAHDTDYGGICSVAALGGAPARRELRWWLLATGAAACASRARRRCRAWP